MNLMNRLVLASVLGCLAAAVCEADDGTARLRLKDGSFTMGRLVESDYPETLGWLADGFAEPFYFDLHALRSVSAVLSPEQQQQFPETGQFFELTEGAVVSGELRAMDDQWVTIRSPTLGDIKVERARVLAISDADYAGQVVYSGPIDDERWKSLSKEDDWTFEAGALVATGQGAAVVGEVDLPSKAQVNIVLSWRGVADFVFSFGTLPTNLISRTEEMPAAAKLEVWDTNLALVREVDSGADVALLSDLAGSAPRVELTLFIDQDTGTVTVCDSYGRPLDSVSVEAKRKMVRSAVHLVNNGPGLTVERFEVRHWDGTSKIAAGTNHRLVVDRHGERVAASISGFDPASGRVTLLAEDGSEQTMALADLRRGDVAGPPEPREAPRENASDTAAEATGESAGNESEASPSENSEPGSREPTTSAETLAAEWDGLFSAEEPSAGERDEQQPDASLEIEVILLDRSRVRGKWLSAEEGELQLQVPGVVPAQEAGALTMPLEQIRGIIGTTERYANNLTEHKNGTLKLGDNQLTGYLDENSPTGSLTSLHWHPHSSRNSSQILPATSGAIVYRKPLPPVTTRPGKITERDGPRAVGQVQIFLGGLRPQRNKSAAEVSPAALEEATVGGEIMFRTGDAIDGVVEAIDERGMTFHSQQTTTTFTEHSQIQHVVFGRREIETDTAKEKLERLMTVPRSMKKDPPTHLFISNTGDFLRGRLLRLEKDVLLVEVRLEVMEIPKQQVAKIIWLHDRDWNDENNKSTKDDPQDETPEAQGELPFRVHGIAADERGLTFQPQLMREGVLSGISTLLGDCSIHVSQLDQLLFGRDIGQRVRQFREDPWILSLAQYPRVYLEEEIGGDGPGAGLQSPLVGQAAPEFGLKTLQGESFRLNQQRGRVLVLDFWASWCGPCIQTMPLVDEAVNEIGREHVQLVAVNIQESARRAQAAIDRLEVDATVLLDVDGEVAVAYAANAIPQTVIIDRSGRVTHVFVGGGSRVVAQFKEALRTVVEQ